MSVPVAISVAGKVKSNTHIGLFIDKYVDSWDMGKFQEGVQKPTVEKAAALSASEPPGVDWKDVFARQSALLHGVKASVWSMATAAPLTMHLSRASALENAGLCLHRVYGFAYLPGTGLKGMVRSYAETVWLPDQPGPVAAGQQIRQIFGHLKENPKDCSASGAVVFHDAWPAAWPKLIADIVNNHHTKYYKGEDAPGDWDEPIPVTFLAVKPDTTFTFGVAGRRHDTNPELVKLAREWLTLALLEEGAGGKTAAGYGGFKMLGQDKEPARPTETVRRKRFDATLELVTPAFLAGAKQHADDCDLRSATLRGQLRWWWRTMHSGFVDVDTLRRMEAAVWGDTKQGGAVRVTVTPDGAVTKMVFDREAMIRDNKLPPTPDRKTTQGITYHSYGMDEPKEGRLNRRSYVPPGTKWKVALTARPSSLPPVNDKLPPVALPAGAVLDQALAALRLLCRYGGVGGKARKGFGSFRDLDTINTAAINESAKTFRTMCGLGTTQPFLPVRADSASLEQLLPVVELPTGGTNYWMALDQVAASAQVFAKRYKHQSVKQSLGLPRNMKEFPKYKSGRHASPVHYHLAKDPNGKLVVRVVAFPAVRLPNLADSTKLLTELLEHLKTDLPKRLHQHMGSGAAVGWRAAATGPNLSPNTKVTATIVADPKGKGRAFAACQGLVGNILDVPAGRTLAVSDEVTLVINSVNVAMKQISFRWLKDTK